MRIELKGSGLTSGDSVFIEFNNGLPDINVPARIYITDSSGQEFCVINAEVTKALDANNKSCRIVSFSILSADEPDKVTIDPDYVP